VDEVRLKSRLRLTIPQTLRALATEVIE